MFIFIKVANGALNESSDVDSSLNAKHTVNNLVNTTLSTVFVQPHQPVPFNLDSATCHSANSVVSSIGNATTTHVNGINHVASFNKMYSLGNENGPKGSMSDNYSAFMPPKLNCFEKNNRY